eukprot:COSAG01_NODE_2029_length_8590_cov_5.719501_15_plen_36_part_00
MAIFALTKDYDIYVAVGSHRPSAECPWDTDLDIWL